MCRTTFHQHAFPADRIGGKVSSRLSGISCSSGVGSGVLVPSVYPSKRYRPESSHVSPVRQRVFVATLMLITSFLGDSCSRILLRFRTTVPANGDCLWARLSRAIAGRPGLRTSMRFYRHRPWPVAWFPHHTSACSSPPFLETLAAIAAHWVHFWSSTVVRWSVTPEAACLMSRLCV